MSDWQKRLIVRERKDGASVVVSCVANASLVLAHHDDWQGVIAYDAFGGAIVKAAEPPWDDDDAPDSAGIGDWTDADDIRASNWLARRFGISLASRSVREAVAVVAERTSLEPVRDCLRSLEWDQHDRVDLFFSRYFGAEDNEYARQVSRMFLIGAVARACRPGCKVDTMPILEGWQGAGKSSGIRALAGDTYFLEATADVNGKDAMQILKRKWIVEFPELDGISRAEASKVKAFISSQVDTYRPSYGRSTADFPRRCVFIGTTNASAYLKDETGARRFLPIRCGRISVDAIREDREQLWGEAYMRFQRGELWYVTTSKLAELCVSEQELRFQVNPWEPVVQAWTDANTVERKTKRAVSFTTGDILTGALALEKSKWTRAEEMRVGAILRRLKWTRGDQVTRDDGSRVRPYVTVRARP